MPASLKECLDDLSARIDEQQENDLTAAWKDFADGKCSDGYWMPPARKPAPPQVEWPKILVNQALDDQEAMLLQQFGYVSDQLAEGANIMLNVRCNYGTVIIPTLFGCELFLMDEELDTLPANRHLPSLDHVRAALDAGVPDFDGKFGSRVFPMGQRFLEVFEDYPVLKRHVTLYHPDVQGPIDNVETVWGSSMFLAFYDEPDLIRNFIQLIGDTYAAFMRQWFELVRPTSEYSTHWGWFIKGQLALREDSLMNLSPEIYADFVRPVDQQLLDEFGGGGIHYCGKGDHFIAALSELKGLNWVNLSQPEMNDMEMIYQHTVDKDISLYALTREAAEAANRPLRGKVYAVDQYV